MSLDLDAIEQRAAAATPGPWWTEEWSCGRTVTDKPQGTLLDAEDGGMPVVERVTDAEFVAHAREDVPALVAEVKRLREHSVTLNSIAWKIASALGDVSADAGTHVGDPVDEADRLIAAVERVRELHRNDGEGWCAEDGFGWPCPTARTLDGASS